MSERIDWKDYPYIYNYNIYLITGTTDGRFFQSTPIKTNDPKHHSTSPSTWFDDLVHHYESLVICRVVLTFNPQSSNPIESYFR